MDVLKEHKITSRADGTVQPFAYWLPENVRSRVPVVIGLHTWSFDYKASLGWAPEAMRRGWIYIQPDFRGPNRTPLSCGSKTAMQDVIDTLDWVLENPLADTSRVYLVGASGGGHMGMMLLSHYPERFTAGSVWCGISDLKKWRLFHTHENQPDNYARNIDHVAGGPPDTTDEVEHELKIRSPLWSMANASGVPIDFNHGVNDGHSGSVPAEHTIRAFNMIAEKLGRPAVTDREIEELWENGILSNPQPEDTKPDRLYGRDIRLRRWAGKSRLTLFDGGHEFIVAPAFHWLARHTTNGIIEDNDLREGNFGDEIANISL